VTGVPTAQPLRTGGYVADLLDGDADPQDPFDVVSGLVYGEREGQPTTIPAAISDVLSGEE
jgi:crotonobetainyl-CoA:carnitine CoA-transferase CaiB-like acyl-CoA transferase